MAGPTPRRGPRVDWATLRRRVEAAAEAVEGSHTPSTAATRKILEERARKLARPLSPPLADAAVELVTFSLGGQRYGIESRYVLEVFRLGAFAPLPGVAPPVTCVAAWRGELLTMLELEPLLGGGIGSEPRGWGMALGRGRPELGVVAGEVDRLDRLPATAVQTPPELASGERPLVHGITADGLLVIDTELLLDSY